MKQLQFESGMVSDVGWRGGGGHADGIEELELPILELGSIATMELLQKSSGLREFGN